MYHVEAIVVDRNQNLETYTKIRTWKCTKAVGFYIKVKIKNYEVLYQNQDQELFLRIVDDLKGWLYIFNWNWMQVVGSFSSIQKCTTVIHQLTYNIGVESWDEHFGMWQYLQVC